MDLSTLVNIVYLLSAVAFVLGLRLLGDPAAARQGRAIAAVGMVAAAVVTLMDARVGRFEYVLMGLAAGALAGLWLVRRVQAPKPLQTLALLNGFGGLAGLLVAWAEFHAHAAGQGFAGGIVLWIAAVFGGVAFSGSMTVWAKLEGKLAAGKTVAFPVLRNVAAALAGLVLLTGLLFASDTVAPDAYRYFAIFAVLALILGVLLFVSATDADMQAVVCLLNGCSGAAACATGFVFQNPLLVAAGALVGAGGVGMAVEICKEAGRSLADVFSGRK